MLSIEPHAQVCLYARMYQTNKARPHLIINREETLWLLMGENLTASDLVSPGIISTLKTKFRIKPSAKPVELTTEDWHTYKYQSDKAPQQQAKQFNSKCKKSRANQQELVHLQIRWSEWKKIYECSSNVATSVYDIKLI